MPTQHCERPANPGTDRGSLRLEPSNLPAPIRHHGASPMSRATTLSNEWQAFWLALGFLTRLPMLARIDYSQQLMNQSNLYFPLVGLILGGLYVALYSALSLFWSPWICVLLVLCFHLWVTGAFHEDGLADSMDALGG